MPKVILYILLLLAALLAILVLYFLFVFICSMLVDTKKTYKENSRFYRFLLNSCTDIAMVVTRLKIHVTGLDRVPDGRFLFVSNHRSNFDPIIQWHVLKKQDLCFVSKDGNFKIPLFGRIIRKCCFLSIDRSDPRKSMKTLLDAAELIKNDQVSIAIYPEGTRSKDCVLLPFHDGVLKVAKMANIPILVSTIQGTEKIHKNYPWKSTDIYVDIIDLIDTDTVKESSTHVLSERVREDMVNKLGETSKEQK